MSTRIEVRRGVLGNPSGEGVAFGACMNISDHGLCLKMNGNYRPGEKVIVSILLPDGEAPVNLPAGVVWTKDLDSEIQVAGLRFMSVSEESADKIRTVNQLLSSLGFPAEDEAASRVFM